MNIIIFTLFPHLFNDFLKNYTIKKAITKKIINLKIVNIRDYSKNKHKKVDSSPVSGGPGLILKCQPIFDAIRVNCQKNNYKILLSPRGSIYNENKAIKLSKKKNISIICGHYEGIDERINKYVNELISIGDFIITGGELASMIIIDSIVRLLKDVLNKNSLITESFNNNLLEYPQYTKPYNFNGYKVPKILYCGNHEKIKKYNLQKQISITKKYRPDLFKKFIKQNKKNISNKILKKKLS